LKNINQYNAVPKHTMKNASAKCPQEVMKRLTIVSMSTSTRPFLRFQPQVWIAAHITASALITPTEILKKSETNASIKLQTTKLLPK